MCSSVLFLLLFIVGRKCRCMHNRQAAGPSACFSIAYGTLQLTYSSKQESYTRASAGGHSMSMFLKQEERRSVCWVVVTHWCLPCHPPKPFLCSHAKYFCNTVITASQHITNTQHNWISKMPRGIKMTRGIFICGRFLRICVYFKILETCRYWCTIERRLLWNRIVFTAIVNFCKYTEHLKGFCKVV